MSQFNPHKQYHATYEGRGEFYTGIGTGQRVLVDVGNTARWSVSIQSLAAPGAWLAVYENQYNLLTDISEVTA